MPSLPFRPRAALALLCAAPALACAQTTSSNTANAAAAAAVEPGRIVVTGSREPVAAGWLAADLVVIDAEQIQASSADSLEDLLRREAGLQLSRNGGPGASAGLMIRGAGVGNTLVLVDGVRIGSATLGQVEFEGLSLGMIERIEVLRGPGSSLYGADGAGGVVQIFTRRGGQGTHASAWLAAGQYGAAEGAIHASSRVGDVDVAGSLSHEQLDGVSTLRPNDRFGNYNPDRDGSRRTTAQAQLGWRPAEGHRIGLSLLQSKLDARYDASEFLPPDYAQDPSPDFHNKLDNQLAAIEHRAEWSPAWVTTLRASAQDDDLHSGGTQIDRYRTRREQLDAQATWRPAPDQRLTFAYEGLTEKADSSAFAASEQRDNHALVLAWLGALGPVRAQLDLRHDDNSVYGEVNTGRLGGSIELAPGWRARALAGTSFRAPSFNDEFYPGYGVAGIRPERGRSVELGIDGRWDAFDVSATAWHNRVRDLIGYQSDRSFCPPDAAYGFGCAANTARARLQGLTLSGGAQWGGWQWRAQFDFTDAKDADTGARLTRRAAHQASLSADYTTGAWRFGAAVLQVGARPDGGVTLPEETTLDLKARWQFAPHWSLEAKLLNATDEDLQPVRDYQGLGRQAWLGVRYSL
ncbi:TonB-dependent receptor domain-containing protein [Ideonella sp.]|uniref:TonB-dependent receptor domain-containing protein n=1 Tax=Ideonella sp. TaxID=1929293 RepID=UPI002B4A94E2|nr:TonB-dependent receptor [Ideonella sp.]HJV70095.1 TonB-dependent receptor [Ideonella sp.]